MATSAPVRNPSLEKAEHRVGGAPPDDRDETDRDIIAHARHITEQRRAHYLDQTIDGIEIHKHERAMALKACRCPEDRCDQRTNLYNHLDDRLDVAVT